MFVCVHLTIPGSFFVIAQVKSTFFWY